MTYDEIHPVFREALGTFEALRNAGFSADDIFFGVGGQHPMTGQYQFIVELQAQGKKFTVIVGMLDDDPDTIEEKWMKVADSAKQIPDDDYNRIMHESLPFRETASFCAAIAAKGFVL